ncbi:phosphopantetheine-binding protein [Longispora sp. NPDC051575]|uniref:phosphopantetheine-binding protein n=1 Tax=Longispora sp. NPDC051575 TaxID=3154943 RepID=UPI00342F9525
MNTTTLEYTATLARRAWSEHLGQPVHDDDDLLSLGAHSLMMALVATALHADLDIFVPLELGFESPRFADYAEAVHRLRGA